MRIVNGVIAPLVGYVWICLVSLTLRVKIIDGAQASAALKGGHILAFWHSRVFYMPYYFRFEGKALLCLVSPSGDGAIIDGILRLFGFSTVRGSTFKHGRRALITLARRVRAGENAAMIVDGSRGPARKAQLGSIYLAKLTGALIIPTAYGAKSKFEVSSWDRTIFPLPFSRVNMVFGKPMEVPREISDDELEKFRAALEGELNRITDVADRFD